MKANEAPEKIFLQVCGDCSQTDCENCKFEDMEDDITWCKDRIFDKDVEYTSTDSFVDKAAEWLNNFYNEDTNSYLIGEDIEKFINYMKGE